MSDDADPRRGAPPEIVGPYLARVLGAPEWADSRVELIAGGKSNLTYEVASSAGSIVLRRPPLAAVLPTAFCMAAATPLRAGSTDDRFAAASGVRVSAIPMASTIVPGSRWVTMLNP